MPVIIDQLDVRMEPAAPTPEPAGPTGPVRASATVRDVPPAAEPEALRHLAERAHRTMAD